MSTFLIWRLFTLTLIFATIFSYCRAEDIERKIIFSEKLPAPLAFYSQAVQVSNTLYISGNLGINKDGDLVEGFANQTQLALDNIGHILEAAGVSFSHVVKVTVFLTDIEDYGAMNEIYGLYFKDKAPARSALAVASLPRNALVEIEAIAVVGNIVDIDEQSNKASGVVQLLPVLVLIQSLSMLWVFTLQR